VYSEQPDFFLFSGDLDLFIGSAATGIKQYKNVEDISQPLLGAQSDDWSALIADGGKPNPFSAMNVDEYVRTTPRLYKS